MKRISRVPIDENGLTRKPVRIQKIAIEPKKKEPYANASPPHLDGNFATFGKVVRGMDVLEAFEKEDVDGETPKRRLEIFGAGNESTILADVLLHLFERQIVKRHP